MEKLKSENRILFLIIVFIFLGFFVWGRFFYLMVVRHDDYIAKAKDITDNSGIYPRGSIFLTDKNELPYAVALNKEFSRIYAVPTKIKDPRIIAQKLAPILEIDGETLYQKLSKQNDPFEVLKRKVSDEVVAAIKAFSEEGIKVDSETLRYYPEGLFISHVVGFLGFNKNGQAGQYGLEEYYEKNLAGEASNSDLVLTIDSSIQVQAGTLLSKLVDEWQAESGSIIVMDPQNGNIMAMTSIPDFDANNYSSVKDNKVFINPATLDRYEPGSVFKPITMAIGIETGAVTPETEYYNTGSIVIGGKTISNSLPEKQLGWQTMAKVLEQSLNTGSIFVEQRVQKDTFFNYLKNFGIDSKTGIDVPEVAGDLSVLSKMRDVNFATAAFGQGIALTPVELLRALTAVVNGGKLVTPHLIDKIISKNGDSEDIRTNFPSQVISPETSKKLVDMLIKVVENGSGKSAAVDGYTIAGKTGTAQIPDLKNGGYLEENIHTFVGFAPAHNPKFIALIKLDKPKGIRFAESTVVPVFHDLAKFIFSYLQIPPDKPVAENK